MPPNPPIVPGDPTVMPTAATNPSIGGGVGFMVAPPANQSFLLAKVEYMITGGAVASQTWSTDKGDYVTTTGTTRSWAGTAADPYSPGDAWSFYWDQNPGPRAVTVKVTLNDPASTVTTKTFNFDVTAPTVSSFKAYGTDTQVSKWGTSSYSIHQTTSIYMQATLCDVPTSGTLGFVQLVQANDRTVGTTQNSTTIFPKGMTILDWNGGKTPYMGDYSVAVTPDPMGGPINAGGSASGAADNPAINATIPTSTNNLPNILTELHASRQFDAYLDWQPTGGIHVEIAHLKWSQVADAVYNGPTVAPDVWTQYTVASNWKKTSNHPTYGPDGVTLIDPHWTATGDLTRSLIKWDMNAQTAIMNNTVTT